MKGFSKKQTGKVGDITAGLPPQDYVSYPYIEWYSEDNGRVVIELPNENVRVIGKPIPAEQCEPVSRQQQTENISEFLAVIAHQLEKQDG